MTKTKLTYAGPLHENTVLRDFINKQEFSSHLLSYTLWRIWRVSEGTSLGGMGPGSSLQLECVAFVDIADALPLDEPVLSSE